ncbi:MAG: EAL domain-containing protein, partial [Thermoanaerobaculia bacterium]|nr:EAL domain-containing protein [Thermoanaerobaculia bacterium]
MPRIDLLGLAALHALTPLALSLLLYHFYRRHRKSYVRSWALYWLWSTLFTLSSWFVFVFRSDVPFDQPQRWMAALVGAIAGFIALGHLVSGSYALLNRRPMKIRLNKQVFSGLFLLGILATLYLLTLRGREDFLHLGHVAIFTMAYGITYLVLSVIFWRQTRSERTSWILLSITFGIFGIAEIVNFLLEIGWMAVSTPADHPDSIAILGAFLQGMVGLAMVIRLLDDERQAALFAASQVEHMAYHDDLTGLPNRSLFFDRLIMALSQAERRERELAVLFIDLDHFKNINDSLGHAVGDALLRVTADRIQSLVRREDTVARFGGDEFVVLMPDISSEDTAKIATKMITAIRRPLEAYEHEMVVTCSIGVSVYPADSTDAGTLVRNADTAMYRAKERGRNRYELYNASMNNRALERLELEMGLRRALQNDEFELYYQPLIDAPNRTLIGFEALLRWNHPSIGLLDPDSFVPAAERCGLIVSIGRWVIEQVGRQIARWNEHLGRDFTVSINLSASELQDDQLIPLVANAIETHGILPGQLEIEITESSAFEDGSMIADTLQRLRDLGVRIAIDDFGSGYSSLSYLRSFPVDTLKIDRLFLDDLEEGSDAAITSSVISLAHGMNLKVVAEGVENTGQLSFLRDNQCDR